MENWLILGLGLEISKMNLDHLLVPESREVLTTTIALTLMGVSLSGTVGVVGRF